MSNWAEHDQIQQAIEKLGQRISYLEAKSDGMRSDISFINRKIESIDMDVNDLERSVSTFNSHPNLA